MPDLHIIAGPNGAGKTSLANVLLPEKLHMNEFVNADNIATGLSPFNQDSVALQAGRLMLERISSLLNENKSFAIETTLSSRNYLKLVREAKTVGYYISLEFIWLSSPELAKKRVNERVSKGGHRIPKKTIERRYHRGIHNFYHFYRKEVDQWSCWDNSTDNPAHIAHNAGSVEIISDEDIWKSIQSAM